MLLVWDFLPGLFPARAHDVLGAFPLAMIGFAYLVYRSAYRPAALDFLKAVLLAAAFFFWAANQLWPEWRQATLFNDIAIALFVLDVFLAMLAGQPGGPRTACCGPDGCCCCQPDLYRKNASLVPDRAEGKTEVP